MNVIWSKYVQGINTLYYSRRLRFHDMFVDQYRALFDLNERIPLKILEIGCGPGALAAALLRWYPNAEITAIDRDTEFIRFAKANEPGIEFLEADAAELPFADNTFDVTISNTVSEHIEPSSFFGEQLRVLKPGGICLVLSARKGINISPNCVASGEFENQFWAKTTPFKESLDKYAVCQYPMSEAELPAAMEQHGFHSVQTGFAVIDLTPDNPRFPADMAHDMINASRYTALDAIESAYAELPERFSDSEIAEMKRLTTLKYDQRISQYDRGEKQWDISLSITMIVRGIK